ncbi:MAG: hypothetical protein J4478_04420 [Candidatus Diapherotrites archaeon]|uniref:ECF transporter S component n=1 Tax=Candidatus Iainarchaeum sp. TaxID=3101447 RepID=A0A8T4KWS9_9ARCH|nr:hypothetical protein [Candidatus Diapherotrites archaeon]
MAEKKETDWSFLQLLALAVVLDIVFKQFSLLTAIQPILPIAVLAGILYGASRGIAVGLFAAVASGLLFYSAVYFTGALFFVQAISAIIAGALGGAIAQTKKPSTMEFAGLTVIAVIVFEALNNFLQGTAYSRLSGYYYLEGTALASALHIIAAVLLAILLSSLLKQGKDEKS